MYKSSAFVALLLSALAVVSASGYEVKIDHSITVLGDSNFNAVTAYDPVTFLKGGGQFDSECYMCSAPCANQYCCQGPHPQCCYRAGPVQCFCCGQ